MGNHRVICVSFGLLLSDSGCVRKVQGLHPQQQNMIMDSGRSSLRQQSISIEAAPTWPSSRRPPSTAAWRPRRAGSGQPSAR
eukprot:3044968-Heterocapsa_arctica.AAC.1